MCLCGASQEIPLAGEGEGSHMSQPQGRAAAQLQGDSTAGGDGVQGAKMLFQHGRNDKAGNVLYSPSPAPRSHHFAVAARIFNSTSRLWTPPISKAKDKVISGKMWNSLLWVWGGGCVFLMAAV